MKLIFPIVFILSSALTSFSGAEFFFTENKHDFPDVVEGVQISHVFEFTNKGDEPLIISGFEVACPCTALIYPEIPILPGQKSSVKLTFDTKGKYGFQDRTVLIKSNAKGKNKLRFRVYVNEIKD